MSAWQKIANKLNEVDQKVEAAVTKVIGPSGVNHASSNKLGGVPCTGNW